MCVWGSEQLLPPLLICNNMYLNNDFPISFFMCHKINSTFFFLILPTITKWRSGHGGIAGNSSSWEAEMGQSRAGG